MVDSAVESVQVGIAFTNRNSESLLITACCSALELGLSEHASHPVLSQTYNPTVFARAPALARDITYLLTLLPDLPKPMIKLKPPEGEAAPLPPFPVPDFLMPVFTLTPPPLATYITHLRDLALSTQDAPLLLAHSYVRYLGDLSGGQYIASKTRKAFELQGDQGLEFYKFNMEGNDGSMRVGQIKEWFREGMNAGVHDNAHLKGGCWTLPHGIPCRRVMLISGNRGLSEGGKPRVRPQHTSLLPHSTIHPCYRARQPKCPCRQGTTHRFVRQTLAVLRDGKARTGRESSCQAVDR